MYWFKKETHQIFLYILNSVAIVWDSPRYDKIFLKIRYN